MKTTYHSPIAALLPAETADILTTSTQDLADIHSGSFDSIDAAKLF